MQLNFTRNQAKSHQQPVVKSAPAAGRYKESQQSLNGLLQVEPKAGPEEDRKDSDGIMIEYIQSLEHLKEAQSRDRTWEPIIRHIREYSTHWGHDLAALPNLVREAMSTTDQCVYDTYRKDFILDEHGEAETAERTRQSSGISDRLCTQKFIAGLVRFHHGTSLSGHLGINS